MVSDHPQLGVSARLSCERTRCEARPGEADDLAATLEVDRLRAELLDLVPRLAFGGGSELHAPSHAGVVQLDDRRFRHCGSTQSGTQEGASLIRKCRGSFPLVQA